MTDANISPRYTYASNEQYQLFIRQAWRLGVELPGYWVPLSEIKRELLARWDRR